MKQNEQIKDNKERLSEEKSRIIEQRRAERQGERGFKYLRRETDKDKPTAIRPPFVRDVEKILNSAYYTRLGDKTQVLSFYRNDDITRRAQHVQLVSRIARTAADALGLDTDLTEAIALGHDIGHTPFGHAGEKILSELMHEHAGIYFNHNVQSVRVLDTIFKHNLTLETLDGILCHNGEMPVDCYRPSGITDFNAFDEQIAKCNSDSEHIKTLIPATTEGCLVRICDVIAYLGKDRQDYVRARLGTEADFAENPLGKNNAQIINNLCVNLVENSLDKDCLMLDKPHFDALNAVMKENYKVIYKSEKVVKHYSQTIRPMMKALYERLLDDLRSGNKDTYIWRHHIQFVAQRRKYAGGADEYLQSPLPVIVADYIAGMTDDYFLELYDALFGIRFHGYFDNK